MKWNTDRVEAVALTVLLGVSVVAGSGLFVGAASASLSTASTEDVITGLSGTQQRITISGQAPRDGDTDLYRIDTSELVETGASVSGASFENVGSDGDTVAAPVEYSPTNKTVSVLVTESPEDSDKSVDFGVTLTLDTSDAIAAGELRYTVVQYDTEAADSTMSPQAAQFTLVGSNHLVATTSNATGGAHPVTHNATLTMPIRVRGVTELAINTSGADYSGVTHRNITVTKEGGVDLVTADQTVSKTDDGVTIQLDSRTTFRRGDEVDIVIGNAQNPHTTTKMVVSFWQDSRPVFASGDSIEINATCEAPSTPTPTPVPTESPPTDTPTPLPSPFGGSDAGIGVAGLVVGLLGGAGLSRWRK